MGTSERLRKTFEDYTNVRCALSQNQSYNVKLKRHGTVPREVEMFSNLPSDVRSKLRLFAGPNQRATKIPYMHVYCLRPFKLFSTKLSTLTVSKVIPWALCGTGSLGERDLRLSPFSIDFLQDAPGVRGDADDSRASSRRLTLRSNGSSADQGLPERLEGMTSSLDVTGV